MSRTLRRRARKPHRSDQPNLFALRCETCSRQLVPTESGYLACPAGHGRLICDSTLDEPPGTEEPCGSLFDVLAHEES